jgi:hypothetical protein
MIIYQEAVSTHHYKRKNTSLQLVHSYSKKENMLAKRVLLGSQTQHATNL